MTPEQYPNENSTPIQTKAIQTHYDYHELLRIIEQKGKQIYGYRYALDDKDYAVVLKVLCYFLRDEAVAAAEGIDLHKGIMLRGPVGCGKTALMHIIRSLSPESYKPVIIPCRDIGMEFSQHGYDTVIKYSRNAFYPYTNIPRIFCLDDLGMEISTSHWGNVCNVIVEVLLSRYDMFISHKMITHVTTNLNSQELEDRYGNRLRSRMREMFNVICFNKDSLDKRK